MKKLLIILLLFCSVIVQSQNLSKEYPAYYKMIKGNKKEQVKALKRLVKNFDPKHTTLFFELMLQYSYSGENIRNIAKFKELEYFDYRIICLQTNWYKVENEYMRETSRYNLLKF